MCDISQCIFYRFGSEKGIWREMQLDNSGGILVSDLKVLIAQETSLARDFARQTNLEVSIYDENNINDLEILDDNVVVHGGTRLIVNRVAWAPSKPIVHKAKRTIDTNDSTVHKKLKKFPLSLICKLCHAPMSNPVLVKCSSNCGSSGCKTCIETKFHEKYYDLNSESDDHAHNLQYHKQCPFCNCGFVTALVLNKKMESLLRGLDLENFELPEPNDLCEKPGDGLSHKIDTPQYYIYNIADDLIPLIQEYLLLPVYAGGLISANLTTEVVPGADNSFVFIITHVGGGTGISPIGVASLKCICYVEEFISTTGAMNSVSFEWVKQLEKPIVIPSRRQPLYNYLGGKKCEPVPLDLSSNQDVIWRTKSGPNAIEVGLKRESFENLITGIMGHVDLSPTVSAIDTLTEAKDWLKACFPNGPVPLYMSSTGEVIPTDKLDGQIVDLQNPYLGYLTLLPFLSRSQFEQIRFIQRMLKQKFLESFTQVVLDSFPQDVGEPLLKKAYDNVWNTIEYDLKPID